MPVGVVLTAPASALVVAVLAVVVVVVVVVVVGDGVAMLGLSITILAKCFRVVPTNGSLSREPNHGADVFSAKVIASVRVHARTYVRGDECVRATHSEGVGVSVFGAFRRKAFGLWFNTDLLEVLKRYSFSFISPRDFRRLLVPLRPFQ